MSRIQPLVLVFRHVAVGWIWIPVELLLRRCSSHLGAVLPIADGVPRHGYLLQAAFCTVFVQLSWLLELAHRMLRINNRQRIILKKCAAYLKVAKIARVEVLSNGIRRVARLRVHHPVAIIVIMHQGLWPSMLVHDDILLEDVALDNLVALGLLLFQRRRWHVFVNHNGLIERFFDNIQLILGQIDQKMLIIKSLQLLIIDLHAFVLFHLIVVNSDLLVINDFLIH